MPLKRSAESRATRHSDGNSAFVLNHGANETSRWVAFSAQSSPSHLQNPASTFSAFNSSPASILTPAGRRRRDSWKSDEATAKRRSIALVPMHASMAAARVSSCIHTGAFTWGESGRAASIPWASRPPPPPPFGSGPRSSLARGGNVTYSARSQRATRSPQAAFAPERDRDECASAVAAVCAHKRRSRGAGIRVVPLVRQFVASLFYGGCYKGEAACRRRGHPAAGLAHCFGVCGGGLTAGCLGFLVRVRAEGDVRLSWADGLYRRACYTCL